MSKNLKLSAGDLDRVIQLQEKVETPAANGGVSTRWVTIKGDVPAKVLQVTGNKILGAGQLEVQFDYIITLRWRAGITAVSHRVLYLGQELEITKQPAELGRRQFLETLCRVRST